MTIEPTGTSPTQDLKTTRHIIAIGGGRGGVGKSLFTVNLGVYLAQLGRDVLIADSDPTGTSLHIQLGLEKPPLSDRDAVEHMTVAPVPTDIPGLRLLPSPFDPTASSPFRPGRKARWLGKLRSLSADYILVHLGAGSSPAVLDLFLAADVGVCVTVPDPAAVESTYRFLRMLFLRLLRRALMKERYRLRSVETVLKTLEPLPTPKAVIEALRKHDAGLARLAEAQLGRINAKLVVNQTRVRSDLELGLSMEMMSARYLGIDIKYIGHIEQDDQAWLAARRRHALLAESPSAKSARSIERIARRVVSLATAWENKLSSPPPAPRAEPERVTLYDVLGVSRGASDEEVRKAYKRQRDLFSTESLPLVSLVSRDEIAAELAQIQEAYDTILDPVRRRAYNLSTFPDGDHEQQTTTPRRAPLSQDQLLLQAELARELGPETSFTGDLLRKVRESKGISLKDIATHTRITENYLEAIEAELYDELPAEVYVRGFVQQMAKFLDLDSAQVVKTYMRRMTETLEARGQL